MRVLVALLVVAVAFAGCTSDSADGGTPRPLIQVTAHEDETTVRFVVGLINYGDGPLPLSGDCSEIMVAFTGPLGDVPLAAGPCPADLEIAAGSSIARAFTWTTAIKHGTIGGKVQVIQRALDGHYDIEATYNGTGPATSDSLAWIQDFVPDDALLTEGPGDRKWFLASWPGQAALENRGTFAMPVAWNPCGVPFRGIEKSGALTPIAACKNGIGSYGLVPGQTLIATVPNKNGAAGVLHLSDGGGGALVGILEGELSGQTWFQGDWGGAFGSPEIDLEGEVAEFEDPARPGIVMRASLNRTEPWATIANHGVRSYKYDVGCGLPWNEPVPECTAKVTSRWFHPKDGADWVGTPSDDPVTYQFQWTGFEGRADALQLTTIYPSR